MRFKFSRLCMQLARRFMQRRRSNIPPDLWQFVLDVREVMLERASRAMMGQLSAAEARRMILEKQSAAIRAHLAYAQGFWGGDLATASSGFFDIYRRAVQSNRKRLCKKRKRWGKP